MSKKPPDAIAAAAVPTSITAADNESAKRFRAEGRSSAPKSEGAKIPLQMMIDQARVLLTIPETAPALAAALAKGEFDFGIIAGLAWLAEELAATIKPTPADRRKTPLLTPAQKAS